MYLRVVRLSVGMHVCHTRAPCQNLWTHEMPFGRDTRMAPNNTVRRGLRSPTGRGDLGVGTPNRRDQSAAANSKHLYWYSLDVIICVAAMPPVAKLLWPFF